MSKDSREIKRRICEYGDAEEAELKEFLRDIEMLAGLTIEIFGENPKALLSPVMREIFLEKGKKVKEQWSQLRHCLCIDKPPRGE